ncbi:MAG: ribonuclease P protein component [Patescibacteria group bacterium]
MLPQKRRISKAEFQSHARSGARRNGKYFSITIVFGKAGTPTKCAVVVSGKISKKAVVRNKVKRRAYEALAQHTPKIKKGLLAVFYARPEAKGATFREIADDIKNTMKTAGMFF